jgi:hypothetical protein
MNTVVSQPRYRTLAGTVVTRGSRVLERIRSWPTLRVVAAFVVAQWVAVVLLAVVVEHNGWLYYQGGDQLWYYTLGWLLGKGALTHTVVGYLWSFALAPVSWIFGANLVAALPVIVLFNVLVLLPAVTLCIFGIASRIGGRLFGYWALLLWLVVPFVGILYTNPGYHQRYTELTLPQSFGLTAISDFPAMVATAVSLYFCARIATSSATLRLRLLDGAAGGAAAGAAIAVKPATALFLVGPALMFLWTRRFEALGAFAAAMSPTLLALAVWKARGLGSVPVLGLHSHAADLAASGPVLGLGVSRYFENLDWHQLTHNVDGLREHFWSGRLLVFLVFAGVIGLARRAPWAALLIGGALLPFSLVKASYAYAQVDDASVFRLLMPCFPMFVILLAAVPLLFPGVPGRLATWRPSIPETSPRLRVALLAASLVLTGVVPLVAFAAARTHSDVEVAAIVGSTSLDVTPPPVPAEVGSLHPSASAARGTVPGGPGRVLLRWKGQSTHAAAIFYRVLRTDGANRGLDCDDNEGARWCTYEPIVIGSTRQTSFEDHPDPGQYTYRVAVTANWLNDAGYGDIYFFSKPVTVSVPSR